MIGGEQDGREEDGAAARIGVVQPLDANRLYRPPPSWDGSRPEKTWKGWRRSVHLWQRTHALRVPEELRGLELFRVLSGRALDLVEHLDDEVIVGENGLGEILRVLDAARGHLDVARQRANFRQAVYLGVRGQGERLADFVARKRRNSHRRRPTA